MLYDYHGGPGQGWDNGNDDQRQLIGYRVEAT